MQRLFAAALLLAAASRPVAAASMPAGAIVLPGETAKELLRPCSRGAPEMGEATWRPTADDIAALEQALPDALHNQPAIVRLQWDPEKWGRQYVGIVRKGHRFIYGNYFPSEYPRPPKAAPTGPVIVCDGGPHFFGVEFDVESRQFTRIDFNGIA